MAHTRARILYVDEHQALARKNILKDFLAAFLQSTALEIDVLVVGRDAGVSDVHKGYHRASLDSNSSQNSL